MLIKFARLILQVCLRLLSGNQWHVWSELLTVHGRNAKLHQVRFVSLDRRPSTSPLLTLCASFPQFIRNKYSLTSVNSLLSRAIILKCNQGKIESSFLLSLFCNFAKLVAEKLKRGGFLLFYWTGWERKCIILSSIFKFSFWPKRNCIASKQHFASDDRNCWPLGKKPFLKTWRTKKCKIVNTMHQKCFGPPPPNLIIFSPCLREENQLSCVTHIIQTF